MIVVSGLKKIYGSGRTQTAALDGVSLALPDRGMVFVLGLAIRQNDVAVLLILGIVLAVTFGVTWLALAAKLRKK